MNTHNLEKHTCLNPYYIAGNQVEKIHFFTGRDWQLSKSGEIVATQNRGWLSMYGSNSSGNSALEAIEYRRKRKPDLDGNYSFFIGADLYVNIAELDDFLFAPDVLEMRTKEKIYYGNRVYFMCGATDGHHPHLQTVELRSFMVGGYSKVDTTEFGRQVEAVVDVFKDNNIKLSTYDAAKILENKQAIIAAVEA